MMQKDLKHSNDSCYFVIFLPSPPQTSALKNMNTYGKDNI